MADARDSTVVVGYDGGQQAGDALALGELLCDALEAKLVLSCVFPFDPRISTPGSEEERALERQRCEELLRDAPLTRFADRNVERVALPASSAAHGLHELVAARKADVLVLGSVHRGPLQRVVPGSVATRLLHGTPCPVAVAPRGYAAGEPKLGTVGLAFDGMEEAGVTAREAGRIALAADAALPRSCAARPG
jgi:nucleotide-binding universal stress UspA family protein